MNFRTILILALTFSFIAGFGYALQAQEEEAAKPSGGLVKAADFQLTDLEGKAVKLSDYEGKVVVLDFWATWCPPCVKEIPHFNKLTKKFGKKGLVVLGISVDREGAKAVEKFKSQNVIDYRVAISNDTTDKTYQSYLPEEERGGIPFTFVIDKEGCIREHFVGYRPMDVFVKAIKPLL